MKHWLRSITRSGFDTQEFGYGQNDQQVKAEILDDNFEPIVKDTYVVKQKQLLALVASLPLLVGLIASVILTFQAQEIRRQAQKEVRLLAEGMCINGQVVIQVGVLSAIELSDLTAIDSNTQQSVHFSEVNDAKNKFATINTGLSVVPTGTITFSWLDESENTRSITQSYSALACH